MSYPVKNNPPISDRSGVTDAVRVQILATEHWSMLATRSMLWNEVFSRASMFITSLSAAVVALALVAQATGFGPGFLLAALLILPVVLLMGIATVIRLGDANTEDYGLVMGMNRLRHAYLQLAPELEPYFTTSQYDDQAGVMQSFCSGFRISFARILGGTPSLIGAINVVVTGVIASLVALALGATGQVNVIVGVTAALVAAFAHGMLARNSIKNGLGRYRARFPSS
jgi:hypothetical protein